MLNFNPELSLLVRDFLLEKFSTALEIFSFYLSELDSFIFKP